MVRENTYIQSCVRILQNKVLLDHLETISCFIRQTNDATILTSDMTVTETQRARIWTLHKTDNNFPFEIINVVAFTKDPTGTF